MHVLPPPEAGPPPAPPRRGVAPVLVALLALVAIAALARFLGPGFDGWYHDDDLRNLRWALEYRDAPWKALTERHALHDHVRPFTLLALWVGAWMADGAFWGQHLVQATLAALAIAGVAVLGRDLSGRWLGGVTSALLAVSLPAFERMMSWTAWICSAGEVCCGIWALVAARRALQRPAWLLVAAPLTVAAGLFKEPGSLMYPVAALTMAIGAWRAGNRGRGVLGVAALVLLGALTFAFTWNPANLARMAGPGGSAWEQAVTAIGMEPALMLGAWPARGAVGAGIPLLVFVAVVLQALRAAWRPRSAGALRLVVLVGACGAAAYLAPVTLMVAMLPMAVLALAARRWEPAAAPLVLYLCNVLILLPFPAFGGMEVSLLGGGFGLALYVGVELTGWLGRAGTAGTAGTDTRWPLVATTAALALHTLLLGARILPPPETAGLAHQQARRDQTLGLAALTQALDVHEAGLDGLDLDIARILPLFGVSVGGAEHRGRPPPTGTVTLLRAVTLAAAPARIRAVVEASLIASQRGDDATHPGSARVAAPAGYYVLGIATLDAGSRRLRVRARDACGGDWEVQESAAAPTLLAAQPLRIASDCGPVHVTWTGAGAGVPVLAALAPPTSDFWSDVPIRRELAVDGAPPPSLQPGAPGGGGPPGQNGPRGR